MPRNLRNGASKVQEAAASKSLAGVSGAFARPLDEVKRTGKGRGTTRRSIAASFEKLPGETEEDVFRRLEEEARASAAGKLSKRGQQAKVLRSRTYPVLTSWHRERARKSEQYRRKVAEAAERARLEYERWKNFHFPGPLPLEIFLEIVEFCARDIHTLLALRDAAVDGSAALIDRLICDYVVGAFLPTCDSVECDTWECGNCLACWEEGATSPIYYYPEEVTQVDGHLLVYYESRSLFEVHKCSDAVTVSSKLLLSWHYCVTCFNFEVSGIRSLPENRNYEHVDRATGASVIFRVHRGLQLADLRDAYEEASSHRVHLVIAGGSLERYDPEALCLVILGFRLPLGAEVACMRELLKWCDDGEAPLLGFRMQPRDWKRYAPRRSKRVTEATYLLEYDYEDGEDTSNLATGVSGASGGT